MAQRRRQRKAVTEESGVVRVLGMQEYEEIRKEPKTVEIHLASALFPQRKITPNALTKMVASKAPASGPYNAVFHFRSAREAELTDQLQKAWQKMPNTDGEWFVLLHDASRTAIRKRVRRIVPKGSIKTSDIDRALAIFSKKRI